jgi:hypothetical protein
VQTCIGLYLKQKHYQRQEAELVALMECIKCFVLKGAAHCPCGCCRFLALCPVSLAEHADWQFRVFQDSTGVLCQIMGMLLVNMSQTAVTNSEMPTSCTNDHRHLQPAEVALSHASHL